MRLRTIALITLLGLGLATHFAFYGTPNSAVFDEVHFGKFLSAYFTHQYYFDIHPPLGKLILAAWGWLWGFHPGFGFANIGDVYPDRLYLALRFLPTLAGALLPLVIFGIARRLRISWWASLLAGVLVALDNALLVQSRFILLDSFLLLFGFSAFYAYLTYRAHGSLHWLFAAGILASAALSIKWTGATFLAIIICLEFATLVREWRAKKLQLLFPRALALVALPLLIYAGVFRIHFMLLTHSGTGDAFMSPAFQHALQGNSNASRTDLVDQSPFAQTAELNIEMYRSNKRLTATHPYASLWYTWPLMQRPIFYWVHDTARIYLIGNPITWWASSVAVVVALLLAIGWIRSTPRTLWLLLGAWAINLFPFIGITRVMFLYHYFTALIWAILILACVVDRLGNPKRFFWVLSSAALLLFIFFAPLSYGLPLSDASYHLRTWFSSWQ